VVSGSVTVVYYSFSTWSPWISASGGIIWIAGGQSTTAFPVVITGTVTAGAGTTVVSLTGSALVSGTVSVLSAAFTTASSGLTATATGLIVVATGTVTAVVTGAVSISAIAASQTIGTIIALS